MSVYTTKVRILSSRTGYRLWTRWRRLRDPSAAGLETVDFVRREVPGKTFVDIGCMWNVNGMFAFEAERSGATRAVGVDVVEATDEFERTRKELSSGVEFVHGDGTSPETIERLGQFDVVLCAGVLYHHPSPYHLLLALRELARETLILGTATIPENRALAQSAVYYPLLDERQRRLWDLSRWGREGCQVGINTPYDERVGYTNWFWGMTPSCVRALVETAGFTVDHVHARNPFGRVFICRSAGKVPEELQSLRKR